MRYIRVNLVASHKAQANIPAARHPHVQHSEYPPIDLDPASPINLSLWTPRVESPLVVYSIWQYAAAFFSSSMVA